MEKLKMHSLNKVDDNITKIGKLFPNCLTERKNEAGEVESAIDFDELRKELSDKVTENKESIVYCDKTKAQIFITPKYAQKMGKSPDVHYDWMKEECSLVFYPVIEGLNHVYQYCSSETFLKIIESKYLRMTNPLQLNDKKEITYALEVLIENIDSIMPLIATEENLKQYLQQLKEKITSLDLNVQVSIKENIGVLEQMDCEEQKKQIFNIILSSIKAFLAGLEKAAIQMYISCFSEEKDSLGQWRGYGDDGKGISIGFRYDFLNKKRNNFHFKQVLYHKNLQEQLIEDYLNLYVKDNTSISRWYAEVLPCIKHPGSKDEHEYRLIYFPNGEVKLDHFFTKNGELRFYYKFSFEKDSIGEIIIGPKSNLSINDVYYLMLKNGLEITKEQIKKSDLPYR